MDIDYIITGIGLICTVTSIIGAIKSLSYYKKSKNLTVYANNNTAYIESKKIISLFGDFLKFAAPRENRGVNIRMEISQNADAIRKSIDQIREKLSVKDLEDVEKILSTDEFDVEEYIDSIIICAILEDNAFPVDANYYTAKKAFLEMQKLLKTKLFKRRNLLFNL